MDVLNFVSKIIYKTWMVLMLKILVKDWNPEKGEFNEYRLRQKMSFQ